MESKNNPAVEPEFDSEDFEEAQPLEHSGPFGVAPVDPIVFKQSTDNPELRDAAAYVQMARQKMERRPTLVAPEAPRAEAHTVWTPEGEEPVQPAAEALPVGNKKVRFIVTTVAVVLPLAAIAGAIWFGLSLLS